MQYCLICIKTPKVIDEKPVWVRGDPNGIKGKLFQTNYHYSQAPFREILMLTEIKLNVEIVRLHFGQVWRYFRLAMCYLWVRVTQIFKEMWKKHYFPWISFLLWIYYEQNYTCRSNDISYSLLLHSNKTANSSQYTWYSLKQFLLFWAHCMKHCMLYNT